ncbi:MAG TPA: hypothetical protein VGD58_24570 [Herpetosiphonaceae bacterium]
MADTQSILQLGIEAARAGNKAEARELFRLVTREDPNNAQGWLWLAGVAEDRDEKRVALERVTQLEPSNQLAQKGLAALGGPSTAASAPPVSQSRDTGVTAPMPFESRPDVTRAQPIPPSGPASDQDIADAFDSIDDYASAPESNRARTYDAPDQVGGYVPPDFGDEDYDLSEYQNRPRVSAEDIAARERDTVVVVDDEEPRRRGLMAWLPLLVVLLLVCIGGVVGLQMIMNRDGAPNAGTGDNTPGAGSTADTGLVFTTPVAETDVAVQPGGEASPAPGGEASPAPGGEASPAPGGEASPAPGGEASPAPGGEASPAPGGEASPAPGGEASPAPGDQQPAASPAAPPSDVASANPAIVANTQPLSAGGFEYSFGSGLTNFGTGTYGGAAPARGQYLIVLAWVRNTGSTPAQIPDGFFVVKDAQGRVSDFNRAASVDYFNRLGGAGSAGDYGADAQLPPGAPLGSVPLLFDISPDATDVVMFSRDNLNQGFRVR